MVLSRSHVLKVRVVARFCFIWAIKDDHHPLRAFIQFGIRSFSASKWNTFDFTWLNIPCNTTPSECSVVWKNLCLTWNKLKKQIKPIAPDIRVGWLRLPIWHPHVNHIPPCFPRISQASLDYFHQAGFRMMEDLLDRDCLVKN